jgi:bidirectional [NiFe] hydrogenase diaphorase subunit
MTEVTAVPSLPEDRLRLLNDAIRRCGKDRRALIEILHVAQKLFGWLSPELLRHVSTAMEIPRSRVMGVATFYHLFHLTPKAGHECTVCLGTACFVKHGEAIVSALEEAFQVRPGETTPDGRLKLSIGRCVGSCGLAPLVLMDDAVEPLTTPDRTVNRLQALLTPTRGQS